ncbi:MAG: DUF1697 domain-containing protein [Chlorobi bacterium]|nr:DUF1697 domain-containing protein [Chlorobiota bacterium]MCI0715312.1 DUF1697 domain-containing protein [Chlorobiota bacterium]
MTYIAFLRGINVSGQKLIKMEGLRKMFGKMGYKNVRTYIQSGNVVFESPKSKNESLAKKIESGLEKSLGYDVTVVIRTKEEIESVIKNFPFSKVKNIESFKTDVAFLATGPDKSAVKELESLSTKDEMFKVTGNNVYSLRSLAKGFQETLLGKNILEKKLKVRATVRNWNTVNKVLNI